MASRILEDKICVLGLGLGLDGPVLGLGLGLVGAGLGLGLRILALTTSLLKNKKIKLHHCKLQLPSFHVYSIWCLVDVNF